MVARSIDILEIGQRGILHATHTPLTVPGGDALLTANFERHGPDLYIHGAPNLNLLIHDYFTSHHQPDLLTANGACLDSAIVTALSRPDGYLQFAQAETQLADAGSSAQPIGKVDELSGTVQVQHTDGTTSQLASGAPVFQGDVISSAADGQVSITFVDGTAFSLGSGARMTLDDLVYNSDVGKQNTFSASVLQGTFAFMTGKIAPSGNMDVKTPVGTIGIRGTTVIGHLTLEGSESTFVIVPDAKTGHVGKVIFTNAGGTQILDAANASTKVASFFISPSTPIILPQQDLKPLYDEILQQFYEHHGGAPAGHQGSIHEQHPNGQATADQLAAKMDLENFQTAAGPGATPGDSALGADPLAKLLGAIPPLSLPITFTTIDITGALDFGANNGMGSNGYGGIPTDNLSHSHATNQDNTGGTDFITITGTPDDDNLGSPGTVEPLHIFGDSGNDVLTGSPFDDQLHGGAGDDILDAGAGNDQVFGDSGNDLIIGGSGQGNDFYDGGDGTDTIEYASATNGLIINLESGTASGDPDIGTDTLVNIENVIGGQGNDLIIGNSADNKLEGGLGDDQLAGQGGNDTLIGGPGTDVAVFSGLLAEYNIQRTGCGYIVTDTVAGRDGTDTLVDIERIRFADGEHDLADLVNSLPPTAPSDINKSTNQVAENAASGTVVGITVQSTDPAGRNITYSLADDAGGRFQIDAATGVITVANGALLDFESVTQHQIIVQASDGESASQHSFVIAVTNVDEAPSAPTDADKTANAVTEHAINGTVVGVTAQSADPEGSNVTYSLSDNAGGRFTIDPTTGVVTVANSKLLDTENGDQQQITVVASDGKNTSSSTFTIGINSSAAPTLDLDANNSSGDKTTGYHTVFDDQSIQVVDSDVRIGTSPNVQVASASIQLAGATDQTLERLVIAGSLPNGITASAFQYNGSMGTLTLSGLASAADYAAALLSIRYQNGESVIPFGTRIVTITVTDAAGKSSNPAIATIDLGTAHDVATGDVSLGDPLIIGNTGHGELDLLTSGHAAVNSIIIGKTTTGDGFLQMSPGSTAGIAEHSRITVGDAGNGQLTINSNLGAPSELLGNGITIGESQTATGTMTVTGDGATVVTSGGNNYVLVGDQGHGSLTIQNGGELRTSNLEIGRAGDGILALQNGGKMIMAGTNGAVDEVFLGEEKGSTGIAVISNGGELTTTGDIIVGERGVASLAIVTTESTPTTVNAHWVEIGNQLGGIGSVEVSGDGAKLVTSGEDNGINVGHFGDGVLLVMNGGEVDALTLQVGRDGNGVATVTGEDSKIIVSAQHGNSPDPDQNEGGYVRISKSAGSNGSLLIQAGGHLEILGDATTAVPTANPALVVAADNGSIGSIILDGVGSQIDLIQAGSPHPIEFISGPHVTVGHQGDGTMIVSNGGLLNLFGEATRIDIGEGDFSDPAQHLPTSNFYIEAGGQVTLTDNTDETTANFYQGGVVIGNALDGNGSLQIDGANSKMTVQSIEGVTVGGAGSGELIISNGGQLLIQSRRGAAAQSGLTVAEDTGSKGTVSISGSNSQLRITSPNLSGLMEGPFLIMAAGQSLMQLGDHSSVVIQGSGANMIVGSQATADAEINVTSGASITVDGQSGDATIVIANKIGGHGDLTVTGTDSHVTVSGSTAEVLIGANLNADNKGQDSKGGEGHVSVEDHASLTVGGDNTHGTGTPEIVIGSHGNLDINNATVSGDIYDDGGQLTVGTNLISTASIIGDLTMASPSSMLTIDSSGIAAGHADKVNVIGDALLTAATIDFHFLSNYSPKAGDTFTFLTATGVVTADPGDISLIARNVDPSFKFMLQETGHDLQFHALTDAGKGSGDVFLGSSHDDVFTGGKGNDAIYGGAGNDILDGGAGNNRIEGGAGVDQMKGGSGGDTFSFAALSDGTHVVGNQTVSASGASFDEISNFDANADKLNFSPDYFTSKVSSITDGVNFSKIDTEYNGTNGTSHEYKEGENSFILDSHNNLIYDNNGSAPGYTIVAHIDVASGSPAVSAHNLQVG